MTTSAQASDPSVKEIYSPEDDVEDLEQYRSGGYHPTLIDDSFQRGRYTIVHKLGYGGYSTIWLARDHEQHRYVSLKIKVSEAPSPSKESKLLFLLNDRDAKEKGRQFVPKLLDGFSIAGPNGNHSCLVGEPAGLNISASKEIRTVSCDICQINSCSTRHGLIIHTQSWNLSRRSSHAYLGNFLLRMPGIDHLSKDKLYELHGKPFPVPIRRLDGKDPQPHAPPHAIYPMSLEMPANKIVDPEILISDYGTSFVVSEESNPSLHTSALYLPPEDFFDEPVTPAADVWTLGVNLYEVLGERPLFETFAWDRDDIIAEMVSTLGLLPPRWWGKWKNRGEFFKPDGSWIPSSELQRITTPISRPLHQRMWDMGRGETPADCKWDVEGGEMRALKELLAGMLAFEPTQRLTAEQVMASEYVTKWALPAWERQVKRKSKKA